LFLQEQIKDIITESSEAHVSGDGPPSSKMRVGAVRIRCPSYLRHCACSCGLGCGEDGPPLIQHRQNAGGVARKAEAALIITSGCNSERQPLGDSCDERTGARHADGRLGGLWSRHDLEEVSGKQGHRVYFIRKTKS
jgi:hypothetical protein